MSLVENNYLDIIPIVSSPEVDTDIIPMDKLVAGARALGESNPIIREMENTAKRSNPEIKEEELVTTGQKSVSEESAFTSLKNFLFGSPEPKTVKYETQNTSFPTSEEGAKYGPEMAYGKSYEDYVTNKVANIWGRAKPTFTTEEYMVKNPKGRLYKQYRSKQIEGEFKPESAAGSGLNTGEIVRMKGKNLDLTDPKNAEVAEKTRELFSRAAMVVGRNAVAELGFDPKNIKLDVKSGPFVNVRGLTSYPGGEDMYVNAEFASTVVHESIHNGFAKLRKTEEGKKLLNELEDIVSDGEELAVRHIMRTLMGDPELGGKGSKKEEAIYFFGPNSFRSKKLNETLEKITKLAEEELGKKKGPR